MDRKSADNCQQTIKHVINAHTEITDTITSHRTNKSVPKRRENLCAPSLPGLKRRGTEKDEELHL